MNGRNIIIRASWRLIALRPFVALLAIAFAMATPAAASDVLPKDGQTVHRCVGVHGEIVFSGDTCATTESAVGALSGSAAAAPVPPADRCPTSPADLRERVVAAIARHDPNAIAGMMHWGGVGSEAARSRLRALRDLTKHELLAIDPVDGSASGDAEAAAGGFRVRTGGGDGGSVHEQAFGIEAQGGCYWLVW